jgi:hypothetical protein
MEHVVRLVYNPDTFEWVEAKPFKLAFTLEPVVKLPIKK